jgi:hypothetical protein
VIAAALLAELAPTIERAASRDEVLVIEVVPGIPPFVTTKPRNQAAKRIERFSSKPKCNGAIACWAVVIYGTEVQTGVLRASLRSEGGTA